MKKRGEKKIQRAREGRRRGKYNLIIDVQRGTD
jgi:hypothetical protein